jgi:hypothetical protein
MSQQGTHLLLQIRAKVINEELQPTFRRWYAGFNVEEASLALIA